MAWTPRDFAEDRSKRLSGGPYYALCSQGRRRTTLILLEEAMIPNEMRS